MGSRDEPMMLALLLAFAALLYTVTWLLAGPPGSREASAAVPAPAIEATPSAHSLGPELLTGLR